MMSDQTDRDDMHLRSAQLRKARYATSAAATRRRRDDKRRGLPQASLAQLAQS